MTKGPALPGSPYSTASFAPVGMVGGAGPHLMSAVFMKMWSAGASAGDTLVGAMSRTAGITSAAMRCMDFMVCLLLIAAIVVRSNVGWHAFRQAARILFLALDSCNDRLIGQANWLSVPHRAGKPDFRHRGQGANMPRMLLIRYSMVRWLQWPRTFWC